MILPLLIWTVFIGFQFVDGFLLSSITSKDIPEAFIEAAKEIVDKEFVGNLATTLIDNGEVAEEFFL